MSKKRLLILFSILALLAIVIVFKVDQRNKQDSLGTIKAEETAQEQPERLALPTMLELGSEGCIPCEKMKPIMDQLTEEYGELINVDFYDVRKDQTMAQKYGIRLIPTQIFLKSDGTEFFRHEGFFPKEDIVKVFRDMGVQL